MTYTPKQKTQGFRDTVESYVNRMNVLRVNNGNDAREIRNEVLSLGESVKANPHQWAAWMVATMIAEYPERVVIYSPNELYRKYASQYFFDLLSNYYKKPVSFQVTRYDA